MGCVGNASDATHKMEVKALQALAFHRVALNDFDRQSFKQGLEVFKEVSKMSFEMKQISETLENEFDLLQKQAEGAWKMSEGNLAEETTAKKEIEEQIIKNE